MNTNHEVTHIEYSDSVQTFDKVEEESKNEEEAKNEETKNEEERMLKERMNYRNSVASFHQFWPTHDGFMTETEDPVKLNNENELSESQNQQQPPQSNEAPTTPSRRSRNSPLDVASPLEKILELELNQKKEAETLVLLKSKIEQEHAITEEPEHQSREDIHLIKPDHGFLHAVSSDSLLPKDDSILKINELEEIILKLKKENESQKKIISQKDEELSQV